MTPMRFHVVSLPHTQTTLEYLPCAYTMKVRNFARMMLSLGHEVYLYSSEDNDAPCTDHITCIKKAEQNPGNWKSDFFNLTWNADAEPFKTMNENAIREIAARIKPRDFICLIAGHCQKPIADAFPENMSVEFGIGYEGVFSKYRVFESYAWMHYIYGQTKEPVGKYYDAVIPNYFDQEQFKLTESKGDKNGDYFLFIGRFIQRKGIQIAADVCKKLGARLIIAGQGVKEIKDGKIIGDELTIETDGLIEHIGTVDVARRADLMSRAKAVFVPTQYIGPFEGVHVEAWLSGTPVITTDWGVFCETVRDGLNGYRCRSFGEFLWAAKNLDRLWSAKKIRDYAVARFSLDSVRWQYQEYFESLMTLWLDGWNTEAYHPSKRFIQKPYPSRHTSEQNQPKPLPR